MKVLHLGFQSLSLHLNWNHSTTLQLCMPASVSSLTCQGLGLCCNFCLGFYYCSFSTPSDGVFQQVGQETWLANVPPPLVYSLGTPDLHLLVINYSIRPWLSLLHFDSLSNCLMVKNKAIKADMLR